MEATSGAGIAYSFPEQLGSPQFLLLNLEFCVVLCRPLSLYFLCTHFIACLSINGFWPDYPLGILELFSQVKTTENDPSIR
jgi:hypothetical protein